MTPVSLITKRCSRYVSLNVLGMIGLSVYILADTYFIANGVGPAGLAALNFAIVAFVALQATGLMIGIGSATEFQIYLARNDKENANKVFTTALALVALFALVLMVGVEIAAPTLMGLLGADEVTSPLAVEYTRTIFAFAPFFLLNNTLLPFVRNDGSPQLSMIAMVAGSLGNIVLDWLFIYVFGWGMFGAAFATGFAPLMSLAVLSLHIIRGNAHFAPVRTRISAKLSAHVMALGFSSFIVELSSGVVLLVLNLIILAFEGRTGVAAYGVVANFAFVATALFVGVAQGIQPLASNAFARSDNRDMRSVLRFSLVTCLVMALVVYVCVFVGAYPLAEAFNRDSDPQLTDLAFWGMRLYFIGYFFAGINIVTAAFLSAVEKPAWGLTISLVRGFVAVLGFVFLLASLFGMTGVWLAFPAAEAVTSVLTIILLLVFNCRNSCVCMVR